MKLNTDGASKGNPGLAAAGRVLRDGDGRWCGGFAVNLGKCSTPLAELWGVYYGLYIVWERRVPYVTLEVDSELVVGFLKTGIRDSYPLSFLAFIFFVSTPTEVASIVRDDALGSTRPKMIPL
ncbi:Ribonuclease H domain [Arabidopsis thaliana x Arabidopsis arenosa]|uniref:Ribonuclease H domain n=1 Tax=Arabidopsis thaliana x Arabidopsis arenosa TaxID=1240361 RepID=A0A8T2C079_9BRAS|nr:Ribonuclease H domain [Arabidopsis thaliana x Arabidopsis arenosa]